MASKEEEEEEEEKEEVFLVKMAAPKQWFNVFVGSETGFLKAVNTEKKYFKNVNRLGESLDREQEITAMCWKDSEETNFYCGLKNRLVKAYDTSSDTYEDTGVVVEGGEGKIRGLLQHDDGFVSAVESGMIKVWNRDGKQKAEFDLRHNVHRLRQNPAKPWLVATGGRNYDLKIWDLNAPHRKKPVFGAQNVPNDFLNLPIPVWVTDMRFIPDSDKIVMCSGHTHIRLYDTKSPSRLPVIQMEFDEYPLTALALGHRENQVIVGNSHGRMALFDLRRKLLVHSFRGFAGSIRSMETHPSLNLVATCGLDRFLRVHEIDTRIMLHKVYLKSRLNCLLLTSRETESASSKDTDLSSHSENRKNDAAAADDDDEVVEEIWEKMEVIDDAKSDTAINKDGSKCATTQSRNKKRKAVSGTKGKVSKAKRKSVTKLAS